MDSGLAGDTFAVIVAMPLLKNKILQITTLYPMPDSNDTRYHNDRMLSEKLYCSHGAQYSFILLAPATAQKFDHLMAYLCMSWGGATRNGLKNIFRTGPDLGQAVWFLKKGPKIYTQ